MKNFCVLPWYSKETFKNTVTPCCLLEKSHDIESVKRDLLAGIPASACQKCWKLEKEGVKSRRQQENEFLDYKLDRDIEKIKKDCESGNNSTILYQITTSNLCNQACVSCHSEFSTKWAEIEKRQGLEPRKFWQIDINDHGINFARARRISLLGGEPLYDSKTFDILEKLIENNNTDCFVTFVTNGSVDINDRQREILSKFSDLNICVSIDGIDKRFEYMRWPGRWDRLCHNLDVFRGLSKTLSVSYTISSLNALYYQETVDWFQTQRLEFNHNIVSWPEWLALENAPVELKKEFTKIDFFKRYTDDQASGDLAAYKEKIRSQDRAKKINLTDYMPEVARIIGYTL